MVACETLRAWLETTFAGLRCRIGWPEQGVEFDLSDGPIVTLTVVADQGERVAPECLSRRSGPDGVFALTRVGNVAARVQVDLWAAYRDTRDTWLGTLDPSEWGNQLPLSTSLVLSMASYHNLPVAIETEGLWSRRDDQDAAERGEWRASMDAILRCDRCTEILFPTLSALQTEATVGGTTETATATVE